ncbi:MAG: FHA domain-containing protein, partial [Polyangiaceae bacterium]
VVPNTYFLNQSGVALGQRGGVVVDSAMKTSLDGVYAAGDVAERDGALLQLWEPAQRQALVAAENLTGGQATFAPGAHYFATRLADLDFASVGVVHPGQGLEERVERSKKTGSVAYRKLLFSAGKLGGALMLGQRSENLRRAGRSFKRLIDEGIDVGPIKDSLLSDKFDLQSWLRGRALVTKPKRPVAAAPEVKRPAAQIRGTQHIQMPSSGGVDALVAAAAAAGAANVGAKQDAPKLTIGLPMAAAAVAARSVERVVAHLEGAGGTWPLDKQIVTLGRDSSCQVQLADPWASGVHAEVTLHNGQHFVRDMGSVAGTWINGMPLGAAHRLEGGDTIVIGQTSLRYVKVGQAPGAPKGPPVRERRVPMLEVRRGPGVGLRFALDRDSMTVGRDPQSELRLDDVQVSRRHAVLSRRAGSWYVCDLHSSRGTYKNGAQLRPGEEASLAEGDNVQFGDSMLVLIGA